MNLLNIDINETTIYQCIYKYALACIFNIYIKKLCHTLLEKILLLYL